MPVHMKLTKCIFRGLVAVTLLATFSVANRPVWAQYYSAGGTPKLVVDKKVRALNQTSYSDNLDSSQYTFVEGESVDFSIITRNSGDQQLSDVNLVDILPSNMEVIFAPGTLEKTSGKITWSIGNLGVGESRVNTLRTRIVSTSDKCFVRRLINKVEVRSGSLSDGDTSFIYVGCKSIPATGDSSIGFKSLIGLMVAAVALATRRLVRGYWG